MIPTLKARMGQAKGLMQGVDENLLSLSYSPDCQNIDVTDGMLSTIKGSLKYITTITGYTIKRIFSYASDMGEEIIIAGATENAHPTTGKKWFYKMGGDTGWTALQNASGVDLTSVDPNYCGAIMAKIADVDYMILTSFGGAVKIHALDIYPFSVQWTSLGGTPPYGSSITWHRERVWIAGPLDEYNTIYYSNAFSPEDWSTAGQTGQIKIETFDGDAIMTIQNVFDDVLVCKRNTIWKVQGDIPAEYSIERVYATQGVVYRRGLCSDGNLCFYASSDGIFQYDGTGSRPILTDEIKSIYAGMDDVICEIVNSVLFVFDGKLTKTTAYVGKCIVYDTIKKTIGVFKAQDIYDMVVSENQGQGKVYYTDGTYCYHFAIKTNAALTFGGTQIAAYWYTPETDFGNQNAEKTLNDICFTAWGTTAAGAAGGQIKITIYYNRNGVQKSKEKIVTLQTTKKPHDIQVSGVTGKLIKLKIENVDGSAFNISGLMLIYENDEG